MKIDAVKPMPLAGVLSNTSAYQKHVRFIFEQYAVLLHRIRQR